MSQRTRKIEEFGDICDRLKAMSAVDKISNYELGVLLELLRKVTRNAVPGSTISKEIAKMANGQLLELDTVKIYRAGEEAGEKRGEMRGEKRGEERGREKAVFNFVRRGKISIEDGAEELGISTAEFEAALAGQAGENVQKQPAE